MPTGRDTSSQRLQRDLIGPILAAVLLAGLLGQLNVGLADNGDYSRAMGWITSGPATVEPNWPQDGTEAWHRRFVSFWIPYWKLDWPTKPAILTSTNLLWIPGAALNSIFYSPRVLYLPNLSILPRLLSVLFLIGAMDWVHRGVAEPAVRRVVKLAIGVPLVFILMASDYVRFYNTFFRETGSLIYLLLFLASLVTLQRRPEAPSSYVFCGVAMAVLATAKASNVYWPLLALPFLLAAARKPRRMLRAAVMSLVAFLVGATGFPSEELPDIRQNQTYASLYTGLLTFSKDPGSHLARLGLADTAGFVGQHCYMPGPWAWLQAHPGRLSHLATLNVIVHEPLTALHAISCAATAMQDTSPQMGVRAEGDPTPRTRRVPQELWCAFKASVFPRGYRLLVTLAVLGAVFLVGIWGEGLLRELSLVGLTATVGSPIEMTMQVLGAGQGDWTRHLLAANLLFDLALTAVAGVLALYGFRVAAHFLGRPSTSKEEGQQ